jgi:peptidoglycan/xylan/chitin deacetylase (PgdA/CDA1 family)
VIVLCYHAVSETWESPLAVMSDALRRQVTWLLGRGYEAKPFTEAVHGRCVGPTLAITFDDACLSVFTHARPLLAELGVPATVFAPTNFVGTGAPMSWPGVSHWIGSDHEAELVAMSWEQLRELVDSGWEVGSHTCSHPSLPMLPDKDLDLELLLSREECERRLGRPCRAIAYPFGHVDSRVVAAAARAGYAAGAALRSERWQGDELLCYPRLCVSRSDRDGRFRRLASPTIRRLAESPSGRLIEPTAQLTVSVLRRSRLHR